MGNQVTKYPVRSVKLKEKGRSTLAGRKLWFDDKFGRLSTEEKGKYLGSFEDEKILVIYNDGNYEITDTELTQRFEAEKIMLIEKFHPDKVITAVYADKEKMQFTVKRFKIETSTLNSKFMFIKEGEGNMLIKVTTLEEPVLAVQIGKGAQVRRGKIKIAKMVEVMGWRAVGAKLMDLSKNIEMEWETVMNENKAPELFEES
jgi:topoisomerase-4 subunit A